VLAVVHDRYFIDRIATEVWGVGNGSVRKLG
jgi:ATPase subunit of ABC transporter with duplicated ATPase domains